MSALVAIAGQGEVCVRSDEPAWPEHMTGDDPHGLKAQLRATVSRIKKRVGDDRALEQERAAALAWCRANGNPHRDQTIIERARFYD